MESNRTKRQLTDRLKDRLTEELFANCARLRCGKLQQVSHNIEGGRGVVYGVRIMQTWQLAYGMIHRDQVMYICSLCAYMNNFQAKTFLFFFFGRVKQISQIAIRQRGFL